MEIYGTEAEESIYVIKKCRVTGKDERHYKSNKSLCSCLVCFEKRQPKKRKLGTVSYPVGLVGLFQGDKEKTEIKPQPEMQSLMEKKENADRRKKASELDLMFFRSCHPCKHGVHGRYVLSGNFYCKECRTGEYERNEEPDYTRVQRERSKNNVVYEKTRDGSKANYVVKVFNAYCVRSGETQVHYASNGACTCSDCKVYYKSVRPIKADLDEKHKRGPTRKNPKLARAESVINSVWGRSNAV